MKTPLKNKGQKMMRVGIVGISGYSGGLLLDLLLKHPQVRVTYVSANTTTGKIDNIWPNLKGKTKLFCVKYNAANAIKLCDIVFLAVPHTTAMAIAPALLKACKRVIDLSADYRFKDTSTFKAAYGVAHKDKKNLKNAVYGLPELYREDIKKADLVANPGCYPTAAILGLAPLAATKSKSINAIAIDAKSGVSGAGRKKDLNFMFSEVNESMTAYKVLVHQHEPEIECYLSQIAGKNISVNFVPHLIPINRGILTTIYVYFKSAADYGKLLKLYQKFYKTEKFVRVLDKAQPEIKNVAYTNYCDIALALSKDKKLCVVTSAIDNLMKGASGQAIENMNMMCGFNETTGIQ